VTPYTLLILAQTLLYVGIGVAALCDPAVPARNALISFLFAAITLAIFWRQP
jgi:hypothetical protein